MTWWLDGWSLCFTLANIQPDRRGQCHPPYIPKFGHKKRTAPAAHIYKSLTRTMLDHTCFTRLPTTATLRQFARRGSRQENDPWRFRQQSSRVISIQFWYLTSLVTSLSVGSDPVFHNGRMQNLYLLGGFLRVCFGSYCLGSLWFTCTLVSPLCTCMIASVFPFCKTGYSINPPQNLCVKRRFLSFPQFPVDFISCA